MRRAPPGPPWFRVACAMGAVAWGGNQFTPLLVMYRLERDLSVLTVYVLLAAYVVGIVPTVLVAGRLSDRLGRRPLAAPGPLVAMAGSAVLAVGAASVPALVVGRVLSGVAVGLAMAVGTAWLKELSGAPWDERADRGAAARRASVALTAGFLLGAAVAGAVAQWAPWPDRLPYLVHVALAAPTAVAVLAAPETLPPGSRPAGPLRRALRVPRPTRRFARVVGPSAPWVFGSAGVAYAVLPNLVADDLGGLRVAFSALATVVTLGSSVVAQPLVRRLHQPGSTTTLALALALAAVGMGLAAVAAHRGSAGLALVAAATLGAAYGTDLVSGLLEVHHTAPPGELAGTIAVFYALTYVGFAAPVALALLSAHASYAALLAAGAVVALATSAWLRSVATGPAVGPPPAPVRTGR